MSEEAIGEPVGLSEQESVFYGCKSIGYTRKDKTDLVWGKYRESIRLITKYTTAYFLVRIIQTFSKRKNALTNTDQYGFPIDKVYFAG